MHHLQSLLSSHGFLGPGRFAVATLVVYALGLATQMLTAPPVLMHFGLWPFLLTQASLTWVWFALHATRLRDAGRGASPAQGIAAIYLLAGVLLVLVGVFFMENASVDGWAPVSLILVRELVTFGRGSGDLLTLLGLIACAALLLPPAFSLWAAAQPGRPT